MIYSVISATWSACFALWKLNVMFPTGASNIEETTLRWVHIVAGIFWVGFLSFFVLAGGPMLKSLDPAIRAKVFPELASRGLWWLRWSALVAWLAGFRYFMILAKTDAVNAGRPHAWGGWIGIWLGCWLAAFAIEMVLIRAGEGALGNKLVIGALVPPEAEKLGQMATLTMQINLWLSFPMLFFMAASAHFPFLFGG